MSFEMKPIIVSTLELVSTYSFLLDGFIDGSGSNRQSQMLISRPRACDLRFERDERKHGIVAD